MRFLLLALCMMLPALGAWAEPLVVEQIEAEGMVSLGAGELESVLEIAAGEGYRLELAQRSAENLRELYRYRGFPEAKVSLDWGSKRILKFRVSEGRPSRIAEVRIEPAGGSISAVRNWQRFEPRLASLLNLSVGDVFDQEKATATARVLQGALQDQEYIGSSVNEVKVVRLDRPASSTAASWVSLQIRVELGEKVSFGFRGNSFFSRNDLMLQVQEQRALGFGRNYLETLSSRILELYQASGFSQASLRSYPIESPQGEGRHVTWVIEEGPRTRIRSLAFEGNSAFLDSELLEIFFQGVPRMLSNRIYVQAEVSKAADFFLQKLKARGYLSARVMSVQSVWSADKNWADLQIYLSEGEQTRIGEVEVLEQGGRAQIESDSAQQTLGVRPGEPFNIYAFTEGLQLLKRWYRNRGYLDVSISNEGKTGDGATHPDAVVRYRDENRVVDIRVEVQPGARSSVGRIQVEGLSKTKEWVVLRELRFKPGDILTESSLFDSEANLRRLGLFSSVQMRLEDLGPKKDSRIVHVVVDEGTPGLIAGGVGFRNDLGLRAFGTTSYSNLFGRNHTVIFSSTANRRLEERRVPVEYQLQVGYLWPWFGWGDLSFRPNLTFQRIQYVNFDAATLALAATWEKRLLSSTQLVGALNYSLERIEQTSEDPTSIDNQTLTIGAITPSIRWDLRDNPLAPTRGFYSSLSFEIADPKLLSQVEPFAVGYTRLLFRSDYSWNLWRNWIWYFSFRSGVERNTQDITDVRVAIPLIKQFALGGAASLRGFREQELNIQDIAVRGTASYVNYRTQLDIPISGPLRVGPFLDAANLLVDRFSFKEELRLGTGLGLHYLTPVGPINFDLGFKVDPRPDEEAYRFYFSIGMI